MAGVDSMALADLKRARRDLVVALPEPGLHLPQDEEWVLVERGDGRWQRVRVHDYGALYAVPGLYEHLVYDVFGCRSPQTVRDLLADQLRARGCHPAELAVLDLGAGNGCVAEELARIGVRRFVGVDICPEAETGAERDRPGLYQDYVVGDLTRVPASTRRRLEAHHLNCMTCVAALGFGDIPPRVFVHAFNLIDDEGLIVFTIKKEFVDDKDRSGFSRLIRRMTDEGVLDLRQQREFVHRVSTSGDPLPYVAFVGVKNRSLDPATVPEA